MIGSVLWIGIGLFLFTIGLVCACLSATRLCRPIVMMGVGALFVIIGCTLMISGFGELVKLIAQLNHINFYL